jgi:hypothetical protein
MTPKEPVTCGAVETWPVGRLTTMAYVLLTPSSGIVVSFEEMRLRLPACLIFALNIWCRNNADATNRDCERLLTCSDNSAIRHFLKIEDRAQNNIRSTLPELWLINTNADVIIKALIDVLGFTDKLVIRCHVTCAICFICYGMGCQVFKIPKLGVVMPRPLQA